jgi:hypothetical protein
MTEQTAERLWKDPRVDVGQREFAPSCAPAASTTPNPHPNPGTRMLEAHLPRLPGGPMPIGTIFGIVGTVLIAAAGILRHLDD